MSQPTQSFRRANDIAPYAGMCAELTQGLDYRWYSLLLRIEHSSRRPIEFDTSNLPVSWTMHYRASEYAAVDPATHWLNARVVPTRWEQLPRGNIGTEGYLKDATQHGFAHGIVVPFRGVAGDYGGITMVGRDMPASDLECDEHFSRVWLFGIRMLEAMRNAVLTERADPEDGALTQRQRQVLTMVACGHPMKKICSDIGIHKSTAEYLLRRASEKLGATSREQAILRAAMTNQIDWKAFAVPVSPDRRSSACTALSRVRRASALASR